MDLHYASILEAHAAAIGDKPAIRQGGHSVSWAQFDDRAGRFASALRAAGLTRGSRVGQLLFNSPEHLETFHGALKLRAIPDDRFGEIVAAILSLVDKEATPQQVLTDVRRHLAGFKIPRTVEVVAEVPRNNVGKPDYVAVRKMLQAGAPTST